VGWCLLNRVQPLHNGATKPMMIHVMRDGQQFGPYTLEDANAYLAQGTLLPTDQAWYEGAPDWVLLTQVPGVLSPGATPVPVTVAVDPMAAANPAVAAADAAVVSAANRGNKKKKTLVVAGSAVGVLVIAGVLCFVYPGFFKKDDGGGVDDDGGGGDGSQAGGGSDVGNTFALKVKPIFDKTDCYDCHDGTDPEDKANKALNLTKNDSILEDVDLKDPDNSELIKRLLDLERPMPKNRKPRMLTSDEVDTIKAWIKDGAKF